MGLFNFNRNQAVSELTPVNKRDTSFLALVQSLFQGIADMFETADWSYTSSFAYTTYDNTSTYILDDIVKDTATGFVYKSLKASNTSALTDTTAWRKVADSNIGLIDSVKYEPTVYTITYALNKRYDTNFVDDPSVNTSDIYLEAIADGLDMFQVGEVEANSNYVSAGDPNTSDGYICAADTNSYNNAFIVKIPAGWWVNYFATFDECEQSVRTFLSTYIPTGIFYEVEDY